MPVEYVHICSRCKVENRSRMQSLPHSWVDGTINDDLEISVEWCSDCWRVIKEIPTYSRLGVTHQKDYPQIVAPAEPLAVESEPEEASEDIPF